jgi:hypothetical protein
VAIPNDRALRPIGNAPNNPLRLSRPRLPRLARLRERRCGIPPLTSLDHHATAQAPLGAMTPGFRPQGARARCRAVFIFGELVRVPCHAFECSAIHLTASCSVMKPLTTSVSPSGHRISLPSQFRDFRTMKVGRCSNIRRICAHSGAVQASYPAAIKLNVSFGRRGRTGNQPVVRDPSRVPAFEGLPANIALETADLATDCHRLGAAINRAPFAGSVEQFSHASTSASDGPGWLVIPAFCLDVQ